MCVYVCTFTCVCQYQWKWEFKIMYLNSIIPIFAFLAGL